MMTGRLILLMSDPLTLIPEYHIISRFGVVFGLNSRSKWTLEFCIIRAGIIFLSFDIYGQTCSIVVEQFQISRIQILCVIVYGFALYFGFISILSALTIATLQRRQLDHIPRGYVTGSVSKLTLRK